MHQMTTFPRTLLAIFGSSILAMAPAHAGYFTPEAEAVVVTSSISFTTFDEFWAGDTVSGVPGGGDIERFSYRLYLDYGLTDDIALDASVGYADVESELSGNQSDFTDVFLGIRWQFLKETATAPDAVVRVGAIISGDYDVGNLSAPGDGADGFEATLKLGKTLTSSGIRAEGTLGYAFYGEDVPDSFWSQIRGIFPVGYGISIDTGYTYFTKTDGIDIGGPGFSGLSDLPQVEEEGHAGELGISWSSKYGYYRLAYSRIFEGRNIGKEETIGLAASYKF